MSQNRTRGLHELAVERACQVITEKWNTAEPLPCGEAMAAMLGLDLNAWNTIAQDVCGGLGWHDPCSYSESEKYKTLSEKGLLTESQKQFSRFDEIGAAFAAWNAFAAENGLPVAQFLTDMRKRKLKTRLAECGGIQGWHDVLDKIRSSKFLTGDNDRGWQANLDFVLQASSFTKLREGAYDCNRNNAQDVQTAQRRQAILEGLGMLDGLGANGAATGADHPGAAGDAGRSRG